jgi:hypothetical protein
MWNYTKILIIKDLVCCINLMRFIDLIFYMRELHFYYLHIYDYIDLKLIHEINKI